MSRTGHSSDLAGMGCDTGCYAGPHYFAAKGGSHPSLYRFIHFPPACNKLTTCTLGANENAGASFNGTGICKSFQT